MFESAVGAVAVAEPEAGQVDADSEKSAGVPKASVMVRFPTADRT
jgi:hypothetical protein